MKYINDIFIKSFRGIRELKISDLGDINVIVGKNNVGKTSVLEAISIIENPFNIGNIIHIAKKRELLFNQSSSFTIFTNLLNKSTNSIEIQGTVNDKNFEYEVFGKNISIVTNESYSPTIKGFEGKVKIVYGELIKNENIVLTENDNNFIFDDKDLILPMLNVTSIDHLLENNPNDIIKAGKKTELIELLNIFDKNVVGLEIVEENKKAIPFIEHKDLGLMPISIFGDGLKKVLMLGASIIKAENGVLLIDEVETAIHTESIKGVFNWFINACKKYNTQVFMTTHSIEVIDGILEGQSDLGNNDYLKNSIRFITLKKNSYEAITRVRNLNGLKTLEMRENFRMELR